MTTHITKTWFEDGKLITEVISKSEIYNREWVGLTAEEVAEAGKLHIEGERMLPYSFARAIEQALKEKNT